MVDNQRDERDRTQLKNELERRRAELTAGLVRLQPASRAIFAAACAERLLSAAAFSARAGRPAQGELAFLLARLWRDLVGERMTDAELEAGIHACEELSAREADSPLLEDQPYEDDGATAVAYAFGCRQNGESAEAAWAAHEAYAALDNYVLNQENGGGPSIMTPGDTLRVLAHSLVQAEFARQQRDLADLAAAGADPSIADVLRDRAKKDGAVFFGEPVRTP